ncbi:gp58-like family protein, partial [Microbulbifer pacificus]|uniref:gp58-like family protein n=1 Tax=Microbulbifer pacificus TaxID=407164 RepID=UPI0018F890CC
NGIQQTVSDIQVDTEKTEHYRIVSKRYNGPYPASSGMYDNSGKEISRSGNDRSYILSVYDRRNREWISHKTYDLYGTADNAVSLAEDLNALDNTKIIVLNGTHAPRDNRLEGNLPEAIYRCGGSRDVFEYANWGGSHPSYVLVGIPGMGEGLGKENFAPSSTGWLDVQLTINNGNVSFDSYTDNVQPRMTYAESRITQLADEIDLKVDVDGIVSQINLNREGVRIKGNLIHLDGTTLINDGVIQNAHIANGTIERAKLVRAIIGEAQIEDLAVTNAKIASLNADKINASSLSAISANLGTVRAGRLLSSNNNLDANLNTGNITLRNAYLTIANGAQINFEDAGNTLTYRKYDGSDGFSRSAGIGVGDRIGGRYPFAYLGTTGASNLDSLSPYFSGFIANSTAATGEDNATNSVNGFIFQMRNRAVGWDKGITFDFNGNPTITMIGGQSNDYSIGALYQIRGKQGFNIINDYNSRSGWYLETTYAGNGTDITFRGMYG